MRFALHNNKLIEAQQGLKGICRGCGEPTISKCGTIKVHHWAHQKAKMCDSWWEPETEWHRSWKNSFPAEWQEVFLPDIETGEKHIADIKSKWGLVIEFQHSHLKPEERTARENFYRDMIWVVDGARLRHDYSRFIKGQKQLQSTEKPGIYNVYDPAKCLPSAWLNSSVPVIFDFQNAQPVDYALDLREPLHCLFPVRKGRWVTLVQIPRDSFINNMISGDWSVRTRAIMENLLKEKNNWESHEEFLELSWERHKLQMRGLHTDPG
jgi:competence protein CoiA